MAPQVARVIPLKILQVGSSMPDDWGGIERYVCFLAEGLSKFGHDVTLAAPQGSPLSDRSPVKCRSVGVRSKYDFSAWAHFVRLFKSEQFDIVNVHFSPDYLVPAWAARAVRQKGLVLTRHVALPFKSHRARQYDRLYDRFIGVSGAVGQSLESSGLPASKVRKVDSGIPALVSTIDRMTARAHLKIGPEAFAVGVFGRLVTDKGQDILFQTATGNEFEVHCFGSGPKGTEWKSRFECQVKFHGQVPDVANAMVAMDAVCVPSVWPEALGLVTLEAMSLGLPVVASNVGGIPEAVADGVNGLLVQPGDAGSLKSAILKLRDDPELRLKLAEAGQLRFETERTVENMSKQTETVYREVLG